MAATELISSATAGKNGLRSVDRHRPRVPTELLNEPSVANTTLINMVAKGSKRENGD